MHTLRRREKSHQLKRQQQQQTRSKNIDVKQRAQI